VHDRAPILRPPARFASRRAAVLEGLQAIAQPCAMADALQTAAGMSNLIPQHILVPHDFSETADHALLFALDLAERLGARVTVMHAYEIDYGFPESTIASVDLLAQIRTAAGTALEAVVARARKRGVPVEGLLQQGAPWREVNAVAADKKADLVIMGTHGRRGVARALLGSVAEKVVRTAPCPVLTVRLPQHAGSESA